MKNIKKLDKKRRDSVLTDLKTAFYAKVKPSMLKTFSLIIGRDLDPDDTKDTEDYNTKQISKVADHTASIFMELGQKYLEVGDSLKVDEATFRNLYPEEAPKYNTYEFKKTASYSYHPFDLRIVSEIKDRFIMQTEKDDDFDSLLLEIDKYILKYIDEKDWKYLKSCMYESEHRLVKERFLFLDPHTPIGKGLRKLSEIEIKKYKIKQARNVDIFVEERSDWHDLIAMKELLSVVKSGNMNYFSIAPGFFQKYMPELKKRNFNGVLFKVKGNELKQIKLANTLGIDQPGEDFSFGPITASILIMQEFLSKKTTKQLGNNVILTTLKNLTTKLGDKYKYYVVTDGCVAASTKKTLGYEDPSLNDIQVRASETFLFESRENKVMTTRMYFTPYNYQNLHITHQHGGVVFGSNDQSMHSCSHHDYNKASREEVLELQEFWTNTDIMEVFEDPRYSPGMVAARVHFFDKNEASEKIFDENFAKHLLGVTKSLYEMSKFTIYYEIEQLLKKSEIYRTEPMQYAVTRLLQNYQPLSKRFLISEYSKNFRLTEDVQPAFYDDRADSYEVSQSMKMMNTFVESFDEEDEAA